MDNNGKRDSQGSNYFYKDETDLFKYFLETYYKFPIFSRENDPELWISGTSLEFDIRSECNQQCEYCYLYKYGEDLYPKEERITKEQTLKNIKIIFDTLKAKKIYENRIAFFAGELVSDGLLFDLFGLYDDYISYFKETCKQSELNFPPPHLEVPINTKSLANKEIREKYKTWDTYFRNKGVIITPSISTDGKYCSLTREKDFEVSDELYDEIFKFANAVECGFHPMVAPDNIQWWVRNIEWWVDMYEKYDRKKFFWPMQLYVRNDGWTDEKLDLYKKYLNKCWELALIRRFDNNIEEMTDFLFGVYTKCSDKEAVIDEEGNEIKYRMEGFDPLILPRSVNDHPCEQYGCGAQERLYINAANFVIHHCHRNAYPQFRAGKLIVKDGLLTDAESLPGLGTWLTLQTLNPGLLPVCNSCDLALVCTKGCLGAQFEYSGEILLPIPSVCNLFRTQFDELCKLYYLYGVFKIALDKNYIKRDSKYFRLINNSLHKQGYFLDESNRRID